MAIPDNLPESLTLAQLRHVWGAAEAEDQEALFDEDDRVISERKIRLEI